MVLETRECQITINKERINEGVVKCNKNIAFDKISDFGSDAHSL